MMKYIADFFENFKGSLYVLCWFYLVLNVLYYILNLKISFIEKNKEYINFFLLVSITGILIVTIQKIINFFINKYKYNEALKFSKNLYNDEIAIIFQLYLNHEGMLFEYDDSNAARLRSMGIISFSSSMSSPGTTAFKHHLTPWVYEWCTKIIDYDDKAPNNGYLINRNNKGIVKKFSINPNEKKYK